MIIINSRTNIISQIIFPIKTVREPLTYEDYLTFPDNDGIRKEVIEGELFMSPTPSIKHQSILRELSFLVYDFAKKNQLGEIYFAPCDVIFSNINIMQPDFIFISKENYQILTDLNIQGAPDLLVEILSPSSKETDRVYKKHVYEKFGVKEYWIIDTDNENVEVWALKNKKFQLAVKANKTQIIKSPSLKGFQINLSEIFNS